MIKASELRIGNWIGVFKDSSYMVTAVSEKEVFTAFNDMHMKCTFEDVYPIPLTEDWLVKFGFKSKWNDGKYRKEYSTKGMYLFYYKNGKVESCQYESGQNLIRIKYVHQLQNLYFALTGNELTIKQ